MIQSRLLSRVQHTTSVHSPHGSIVGVGQLQSGHQDDPANHTGHVDSFRGSFVVGGVTSGGLDVEH